MGLRINGIRPLTSSETEQAQALKAVIGAGLDRRRALRLIGLSGAFATCLITLDRARAYIPAVIRVVSVPRVVAVSSAVVAGIELWNVSNGETLGGRLLLQHEEPTGLIHKRTSPYFEVPPQHSFKLTDSDFIATTVGLNRYIATSEIDSKFSPFSVINQ